MNSRCETIQDRLPAYSEDDLPASERELVESHLEACADCRKELHLLERAWDVLDCWEHPDLKAEPDPLFRAKVWEKIRQAPPPTLLEKLFGWGRPVGQAASALVVGLVAVTAFFGSRPAGDPPVVANTPEALDPQRVVLSREPFEFRPDSLEYSPLDAELSIELATMDIGRLSDDWMDDDVLDQALPVRTVSW